MSFTIKVSGAAPALRICSWRCQDCGLVWERRLTVQEQEANDPQQCEDCESFNTDEHVGTIAPPKVIVEGNHDFAVRQRARLAERSTQHFYRSGGRDEAVERDRSELRKAREVVGE